MDVGATWKVAAESNVLVTEEEAKARMVLEIACQEMEETKNPPPPGGEKFMTDILRDKKSPLLKNVDAVKLKQMPKGPLSAFSLKNKSKPKENRITPIQDSNKKAQSMDANVEEPEPSTAAHVEKPPQEAPTIGAAASDQVGIMSEPPVQTTEKVVEDDEDPSLRGDGAGDVVSTCIPDDAPPVGSENRGGSFPNPASIPDDAPPESGEPPDEGKAAEEEVEEEAAVKDEEAVAPASEDEEVVAGASELCAEKEVDLTAVKDLISSMADENEEGMRFSMWDCGGQAGFDDAHSLFLTRWSIYLLTVNMQSLLPGASSEERLESLGNIRFWLNSIAVHAVDPSDNSLAPIVIIGTHKDKVSNPKEHEAISKMLYDTFSHTSAWNRCVVSFKNGTVSSGRGVLWLFPVDNTQGQNDPVIPELRQVIQHTVQQEKYSNHKVPFEWLRVQKQLQTEAEADSCYITLVRVRAICEESGMPSMPEITLEDELNAMLKFLHQFGYVMHHQEPNLRDVIVLDPVEFLVKPTARVMSKLDIHDNPFIERARKHGGTHFARLHNGGLLHRGLLVHFWADCLENQRQLEALAVKYGLFIPLMDDDEHGKDLNDLQYIVPAQLKQAPSTREIDEDQCVAYLCFAPSDVLDEWRGKKRGYVSSEDAKRDGFLPRSFFANVASLVVAHAQCLFNMSYEDMELSRSEIKSAFGKHRFCLRELADDNMIELLIQVETGVLIADTLLSLVGKTVCSMMPGLKYALLVPTDGGRLIKGRNAAGERPAPRGFLVILDGAGGLQQRLESNSRSDIPIGPGKRISSVEARRLFASWLISQGFRRAYDLFCTYRWSGLDTEMMLAIFSKMSTELIGASARQVQVFLDRHRLQDGQNFSTEFSTALIHSTGALPIVSAAALQRFLTLTVSTTQEAFARVYVLICSPGNAPCGIVLIPLCIACSRTRSQTTC